MYTPPLSRRAAARARAETGLPPRRRGGQPGNSNRLLHGRFSGAFAARRRKILLMLRATRELVLRLAQLTAERRAARRAHAQLHGRRRCPVFTPGKFLRDAPARFVQAFMQANGAWT